MIRIRQDLNDDTVAEYFIHGKMIARIINPHFGINVGEGVILGGGFYLLENCSVDEEKKTISYHLSNII